VKAAKKKRHHKKRHHKKRHHHRSVRARRAPAFTG
jgi:hypothetical protein